MVELSEVWCFKGAKEVVFWFVLLFCKLLWRDLGELVSVMERDPSYSMETLYELCESRLREGIGEEILREWRDEEKKNIYDVGWSEEGKLFGK
jgi:predicted solute-binding protein